MALSGVVDGQEYPMTACPYCQTTLDGVHDSSAGSNEGSTPTRYVLCTDCNLLVAGVTAH